jgi:hypothetical protein
MTERVFLTKHVSWADDNGVRQYRKPYQFADLPPQVAARAHTQACCLPVDHPMVRTLLMAERNYLGTVSYRNLDTDDDDMYMCLWSPDPQYERVRQHQTGEMSMLRRRYLFGSHEAWGRPQ